MSQKFYLSVIGLLIGFILVVGMFVALRLRATYRTETELQQLELRVANHLREHETKSDILNSRIDELERALFGDIYAKIAKVTTQKAPVPSSMFRNLETLMFSRDKELQTRLDRLERWRLTLEAKQDSKPRAPE